MKKYENFHLQFIGGEWGEGSSKTSKIADYNPYTGELILEFISADEQDVDAAYQAAKLASKNWAVSNFTERRDIMSKALELFTVRKQEFIDLLVMESGSTLLKAKIEFDAAIEGFKFAIGMPARLQGYISQSSVAGKEARVYRKPLGVIGVISPWNLPFYLSLRSVIYALAVGNTVVLKPAPQTPITGGSFMGKLFEEAGIPKGVFNVVMGSNEETGDAFVENPIPRLISFTGSTRVGSMIGEKCGRLLKKAVLEMGGDNAFIVREDADIDYAVNSAAFGKFLHQGQICMAINRILIHENIYQEFAEKFIAKIATLKYGNPADPDVIVGPLIEKRQVDRILKNIDESIKAGAILALGGTAEGNVIAPTVITNATNKMPIACDEIFGPVAVLIPFKDDEEAIQMANDSIYGLSGALHTKDLDKGVRIAQQIETGMVHINDQSVNDEPQIVFGGEKSSGLTKFNADEVVAEFTTLQVITVQYEHRKYPF
ncbi:aldehyde dehydrogenase family protein [Flavobacterium salmonis]|uniref:Succinate-semialdehyde dehydrogenase n=1 Tax=Flavobacterium salmonis TaxID=2654844 RepID=A0A6V6Z5V0_9FLAO|nr:aldehyde dehydrogenase family protein [Flavobacterium salmonis]CAD0007177.1 succinate-semialdehyde dehydrogenase [Flavobacterium salmonis]